MCSATSAPVTATDINHTHLIGRLEHGTLCACSVARCCYCCKLASVISFTVVCIRGRPRSPSTPLDDVYNRDALAGCACPQPLPSSLDIRRGRRHLPAILRCGVCLCRPSPSPHPPPVTLYAGKTARFIAVKFCHRYDLSPSHIATELTCHRFDMSPI